MLKDFSERLIAITEDCRDDMHEPDEQDVSAIVKGNHLDNAMGDDPSYNCNEFSVQIIREDGQKEWFNLATLIALARIGAKEIK